MNISYNWLKEFFYSGDHYVDQFSKTPKLKDSFPLSPHEVADALTSIGLESGGVEEVQSIKGGLKGLVVGEVLTCVPHPNSDHLHITTVNLGTESALQIVCGAPNVAAGQKVIVATVGTILYTQEGSFAIKKGKIRGEESLGMICAEDEIGIGTSHEGIIVLPADALVGTPAADYYGLKSDFIIEVDITPNRADAASHYGVARDLFAYLTQNSEHDFQLSIPSVTDFKQDNDELDISVKIENSEACLRYAGVSIKGVTVSDSPKWLQTKLKVIGLRPINCVVDVTNYILHAFGQPLHAFDAAKVGGQISIKTLPTGTFFTTLDGVERKLHADDLVICNQNTPLCLAGVFGGSSSGVSAETTDVFLESACFHPTWVRKTARRHGLNTDSSFRFERGTDVNSVLYCLKLAALMIKELAGGTISSAIKDSYPTPILHKSVTVTFEKINQLIGQVISKEEVLSIVKSLEMEVVSQNETQLDLLIPPYRPDVERDVDVIEDILRIYGYNKIEIPTSFKASLQSKGIEDQSHKLQNLISEQLVGAGFNEIINNSLTKSAYYEGLESYASDRLVMLLNPLSTDLNCMRQTLLFGGLESLVRNVNRRQANLRFFEFGNCYRFDSSQEVNKDPLNRYSESTHLGLWVTGKRVSSSWAHADENSSIYELKAIVEHILQRMGLDLKKLVIGQLSDEIYSSALTIHTKGGAFLATLGVLAEKQIKSFDLTNEVYYADIDWSQLMRAIQTSKVSYAELSKYPTVRRDLALLIDKEITFAQIELVAYQSERKLLKEVALFDVYEGKNLEEGKKSYALYFMLADETQTLTEKQIEGVMSKIIRNLENTLGAKLR